MDRVLEEKVIPLHIDHSEGAADRRLTPVTVFKPSRSVPERVGILHLACPLGEGGNDDRVAILDLHGRPRRRCGLHPPAKTRMREIGQEGRESQNDDEQLQSDLQVYTQL